MNPQPLSASIRLPSLVLGLLVLAVVVNALAYTASAANPVIVSDNWFFLDRLVIPYAQGLMEPGDLLLKRGELDHSQPLQRMLLIANYEWFDLDLRVEAVFAVVMGALSLLLLGWLARQELRGGGLLAGAAFATMAAVYFSLSATVVFTWSLVTLGFLTNLVIFLWLAVIWRALADSRPAAVGLAFVATLLLGLVADDTGLIAVIAVSAACLLHGFRAGEWRPATKVVVAVFAGYVAYSMLYGVIAPSVPGDSSTGLGLDLGSSVQALKDGMWDAWLWAVVPLTQSLVHRTTLIAWFGDAANAFVIGIAAVLAGAHLWFWAKAFRGTVNRPAFVSVAVMLLFYGWVAGIILARVPEFGVDYLWQPRYASIYRMHLVALLLMLVAQAPAMIAQGDDARAARQSGRTMTAIAAGFLCAMLLVQVPLTMVAWREMQYLERWNENMALQLQELARDPTHAPQNCVPQLKLCQSAPADRTRIVNFLSSQNLSVFSADVRARNDLPSNR